MPKPQNVTDDQIKEALLSGMKNIRTTLHCKPERISKIRKELIMQQLLGTNTKEPSVPVPKEQDDMHTFIYDTCEKCGEYEDMITHICKGTKFIDLQTKGNIPNDLEEHRIDNVSAFRNLLLRELEMVKGDRDVLLVRCLCQQKVHIVQNYILPFLERLDKDIQLIQEMTNNI